MSVCMYVHLNLFYYPNSLSAKVLLYPAQLFLSSLMFLPMTMRCNFQNPMLLKCYHLNLALQMVSSM